MRKLTVFLFFLITACGAPSDAKIEFENSFELKLDLDEANRLASLPLKCIQNPLPYKSGITVAKKEDLAMPQEHHPAFYGCYDWHSAVHGHWSLVYLMKTFPDLKERDLARRMLDENLTAANIQTEIDYFSLNNYTGSFERTYGWAWIFKLAQELHEWDDAQGKTWLKAIMPLAKLLSEKYQEYLPKLVYPIRVGEHSNSAFGLSFAYDYAIALGDDALAMMIRDRAKDFYSDDTDCPISWEPSGYDFLSPCLQEIDIMRKVLSKTAFDEWFAKFLPGLAKGTEDLAPGQIKDRSDGKLVHLDGLNYSRAWCLYPLSEGDDYMKYLADKHMDYSLSKIKDGDYMGEHWLASFALYAYKEMNASQSK